MAVLEIEPSSKLQLQTEYKTDATAEKFLAGSAEEDMQRGTEPNHLIMPHTTTVPQRCTYKPITARRPQSHGAHLRARDSSARKGPSAPRRCPPSPAAQRVVIGHHPLPAASQREELVRRALALRLALVRGGLLRRRDLLHAVELLRQRFEPLGGHAAVARNWNRRMNQAARPACTLGARLKNISILLRSRSGWPPNNTLSILHTPIPLSLTPFQFRPRSSDMQVQVVFKQLTNYCSPGRRRRPPCRGNWLG